MDWHLIIAALMIVYVCGGSFNGVVGIDPKASGAFTRFVGSLLAEWAAMSWALHLIIYR